MAFARTGMNPIGGQSKKGVAPQMWTYTSADAIATVLQEARAKENSDEVGNVVASSSLEIKVVGDFSKHSAT